MPSIQSIARGILALHASRARRDIRAWHSLAGDLCLSRGELALVALEVERLAGVPLPLKELFATETVGDFFVFLARSLAYEDRLRVYERVA
jgi:hypothetical protein